MTETFLNLVSLYSSKLNVIVMLRRIHGFLSREDVALLEEASKRKLKYPKVFTSLLKCTNCDYNWFYKTAKCPACESTSIKMGAEAKVNGVKGGFKNI